MDAACAGMPFYTSSPSIEGNDTGETATLIRHKLGRFATFNLTVAGYAPDRNPIEQAAGAARWLERRLHESTGKRFFVRGVVIFPGWFVEQRGASGEVWVLEPKMLPGFIGQAPEMIAPSDVALAADHLSRYVRSRAEKAA